MSELASLVIGGLLTGGLYALLALPIVIIYKSTQVVSVVHGQLFAFAALSFWFAYQQLPFIPSLLIAIVITCLLAFVMERFALRPLIGQPLFSTFLMTFALFMFLDGIFQLILGGRARGISAIFPGTIQIIDVTVSINNLVTFGVAVIIFIAITLFFRYTKAGLGMRATAEGHQLSQAVGINVRSIFTISWIVSALLAAFGGITAAQVVAIHFPLPWLIMTGLVVALVGGLDSIKGAFYAGLILGVLQRLSAFYIDPLVGGGTAEMIPYVLLLFILLVKPYGLFGLARIERI